MIFFNKQEIENGKKYKYPKCCILWFVSIWQLMWQTPLGTFWGWLSDSVSFDGKIFKDAPGHVLCPICIIKYRLFGYPKHCIHEFNIEEWDWDKESDEELEFEITWR